MIYEKILNDYSPGEILSNEPGNQNLPRPSILLESRKEKYRGYYASKWANLKFFLQDKTSLEASTNLLKTKTVEQFSSKCQDVYKKKIEIQLLNEKIRRLILQGGKSASFPGSGEDFEVLNEEDGLPTDAIPKFLFMFRKNNHLMLKLIENISLKKVDILVPFICHYFYENFYNESMEQEEIIYLVYLLLEKEIDKLIVPSEQTFLDEGFLPHFLNEMGRRYEIKNYFDIILNDLICCLEETHISFYSLDLYNDNLYISKNSQKNKSGSLNDDTKKIESKNTFISNQNMKSSSPFNSFNSKNNDTELINHLPNVKFDSSQKYLLEQYFKEKNESVKQFLFKHIKKIREEKKPFLFDCSYMKNYLKNAGKLSQEYVDQYNIGYNIITKFITDLLTQLENDAIVPYSIKVICRFIYILMKKKFKDISKFELNKFVCRFLFDKLILPILISPESNNIGKDRIISFTTRKNLFNIYLVLKYLVKGELFNYEKKANLVLFNKFILENYHRINKIIEKMIDVKIPEKLDKLSKQFYSTEDFILDNSKRSEEEINYEYFVENPKDFMQHKSICFTTNELNTFYNIVDENKSVFLIPNTEFKNIFETLSNLISMIKGKPNQYYVIIRDEYSEKAKKLLQNKEANKSLGKSETSKDIIENLKYCISYLISNLDILPHWDWVNDNNYNTLATFEYINNYLNSYESIDNYHSGSVPLNWYSLYIINNLNSIEQKYSLNDYQLLYEEIESEIRQQHKKLSELNEFLTVDITGKLLLIDNKNKIFEEELKNVRNTFINIKTLQLMDFTDFSVYLTNKDELLKRDIPLDALDNFTGRHNLILQKERFILDIDNNKTKFEIPKEYCCSNINHFISQLLNRFSKIIKEDIKTVILYDDNKKKNISNNFETNKETKCKNILDKYLDYIYQLIIQKKIFHGKKTNSDKNYENEINNIKSEDIAKNSLMNYILKCLCVKIQSPEIPLKEDVEFNQKCIEKENTLIKDLKRSIEEIYDENIFERIISHIKKLDELRTPEEMLQEIELAIQLINSLNIFMKDTKEAGFDNLIYPLIYSMAKAKPKRIFFNIKFINYFYGEKIKMGKYSYCITQAISSMNVLMNDNKIERESTNIAKRKNIEKDDGAAPTPQQF